MKSPRLRIVTPSPEPSSPWVTLSPEAKRLLAAIGAEASRLRRLESLPTAYALAEAKGVSLPMLRSLVDKLEASL